MYIYIYICIYIYIKLGAGWGEMTPFEPSRDRKVYYKTTDYRKNGPYRLNVHFCHFVMNHGANDRATFTIWERNFRKSISPHPAPSFHAPTWANKWVR